MVDLVAKLLEVGPNLDTELKAELMGAGPEFYEQLIVIARDIQLWGAESPAGWAPVHALNLLAAAGEPALMGVLLQLLESPGVPDLVVEGAPTWLCVLPTLDLITLTDYVRDRRRPELARASIACVIHGVGARHPELRPRVLKILRQLHREADSIVVQSWLGCALAAIDGRGGASPLQTWFGDLETLRPYLPEGLNLDEVRGVAWESSFEHDPMAFYRPEHQAQLRDAGPDRRGWRWRPVAVTTPEGEPPPWYEDVEESWAQSPPGELATPHTPPALNDTPE